jgi:hypothetical protein
LIVPSACLLKCLFLLRLFPASMLLMVPDRFKFLKAIGVCLSLVAERMSSGVRKRQGREIWLSYQWLFKPFCLSLFHYFAIVSSCAHQSWVTNYMLWVHSTLFVPFTAFALLQPSTWTKRNKK